MVMDERERNEKYVGDDAEDTKDDRQMAVDENVIGAEVIQNDADRVQRRLCVLRVI